MKRTVLTLLAGALAGLVIAAAGARATGGDDRYQVSPSGQGAFVVLDRITGQWEHVATRPDAQGRLTVMRGAYRGDQVDGRDVPLKK
ncbi:MAG: hypothetical protein ABIK65_07780 [Candidatus Eisenbacteria bacterium]